MKWKVKHYNDLEKNTLYNMLRERVEVFVVEQECPYPEIDGKDKKSYHLWAEDNNEIIAYTRIIPKGIAYEEASLGRVLVKMNQRGRGLGRKLMNKSIDFITKELNENEIRISAQERLCDFYVSLGFEKVSEIYLEDEIPHIEMYYNN